MSQEIEVKIYGHAVRLHTDLDPDYVRRLADVVDAKMRALAAQTATLDTRRLALLVALNLADELQQLKQAPATVTGWPPDLLARLERLNQQLEGALLAR